MIVDSDGTGHHMMHLAALTDSFANIELMQLNKIVVQLRLSE